MIDICYSTLDYWKIKIHSETDGLQYVLSEVYLYISLYGVGVSFS